MNGIFEKPRAAPARSAIRPLLAALLTACGIPAAVSAAEAPGLVGRPAPDFTLHALAGHNLRLSDARGEVVLISFWTSWCGGCKEQLERTARLYSTYRPAGLVVIGVNLDDDRAKAARFAQANGADVPQGYDEGKTVARSYAVNDVPLTVLVDRAGVVRYLHGEYARRKDGELVEQLRKLLDE